MIFKRKSNIFLLWLAANVCALLIVFVHAHFRGLNDALFLKERTRIVEKYGLTDLCLFTDAQYTRNPAMADFATPFQDHPSSMEHFPSGSIIGPPPRLTKCKPGGM
ncbi:MAG: hypothetical protein NT010_08325 [Proteobacteria bacterium]|nr:hypothetical protein [Pseudomonadota bacterium]